MTGTGSQCKVEQARKVEIFSNLAGPDRGVGPRLTVVTKFDVTMSGGGVVTIILFTALLVCFAPPAPILTPHDIQ